MDQWDYATGMLMPGEVVVAVQQHVRLYDGDEKVQAKIDTGRISLTTHRLLWETTAQKACFYLQRVQRLEKESKSFFSGKSPKIILYVFPQDQSKPVAPSPFATEKNATFFKLGFTQGGLDEFIVKLTDTLRQRNWEKKQPKPEPKRRLGILGIERDIKDEARKTDKQISEAFHDLKSLVEMAKPMVQLAKKISDKQAAAKQRHAIASGGASTAEGGGGDDTLKFRKQMLSLGIEDPVTKEAFSNKDEYHLHLAMEICKTFDKLVLKSGGMMTLVEVYCRPNRARGIHVISPHDLMSACLALKKVPNAVLTLREFDSKVKVIQHSSYDDDIVVGQILSLLEERGSLTPDEYAHKLKIPMFVAKQGMIMAEKRESVCRDESVEGLRFYPNLFLPANTEDPDS